MNAPLGFVCGTRGGLSGGSLVHAARHAGREGAALPDLARHRHVAAKEARQAARDAQSDAGPGDAARCLVLHLPERVENALLMLRRNPDPRVADLEAHVTVVEF